VSAFAVTIALSIVSAVCYAWAAVVQQRSAANLPPTAASLVVLRHPGWWVSVALNLAGAILHIAALRFGSLTVVQPLGTLTLVVALPLAAAATGRKVTRGERRGAAATVLGLIGLLVLTANGTPDDALNTREVIEVATVTGIVLLALIVAAARSAGASGRGLTYALAAGIASGVGSGLAQTIVLRTVGYGLAAIIDPVVVVVLVLATSGLLLSQAAYRDSELGGPLAMLTLANPVAAALIGLTLLGEGYSAGFTGAGLALGSAVVAGYGVAVLARAEVERPSKDVSSPSDDHRHTLPHKLRHSLVPAQRVAGGPIIEGYERRHCLLVWRAGSKTRRSAGGLTGNGAPGSTTANTANTTNARMVGYPADLKALCRTARSGDGDR
jgi:hypothetical protein